jgi:hypothetical protein
MVGRVGGKHAAAKGYPARTSFLEHLAGRVAVDYPYDMLGAAAGTSLLVLHSHERSNDKGPGPSDAPALLPTLPAPHLDLEDAVAQLLALVVLHELVAVTVLKLLEPRLSLVLVRALGGARLRCVHSGHPFCGPRSGLVAASAGAPFSNHHCIDHFTAIYYTFSIHFGYTVGNKWRRNV